MNNIDLHQSAANVPQTFRSILKILGKTRNKKTCNLSKLQVFQLFLIAFKRFKKPSQRKGRDSNPRYSHPVYSLSRTAHSTTLTPFRVSVHKCSNFLIYCNLIRVIYHRICYILLRLSVLFLFFNE